MHEMSIAEGIVQVMEDQAAVQAYHRVKKVWLEIGPLACIEKSSLSFCFDAVTRDTIADGAALEIIDIPGQGWCLNCAKTVPVNARYDACPECGSYQIQITAGDELRIKEMEVE